MPGESRRHAQEPSRGCWRPREGGVHVTFLLQGVLPT